MFDAYNKKISTKFIQTAVAADLPPKHPSYFMSKSTFFADNIPFGIINLPMHNHITQC